MSILQSEGQKKLQEWELKERNNYNTSWENKIQCK